MKKTALLSLLVAIPFAQFIHVNADAASYNMNKGTATLSEDIKMKLDKVVMKVMTFDEEKIDKIKMYLERKIEMEKNMTKKSVYEYILMKLNADNETAMMEDMEKEMEMAGNYTKYSGDLIGKTDNTVLFFYASWCPSCRAADKNIKEDLENIPEGLSILMTNYDKEKDLRKKYGVTSQHTFVQVDEDGNLIKKWLGSNTIEEINSNLE